MSWPTRRWAGPPCTRRANAAIPLWPPRDHTGFTQDELTLRVFAVPDAPACERELYEDGGEGYGEVARRTVRCDGATLRLSERQGGYVPPREHVGVEVGAARAELPESAAGVEIALP